MTHDPYDLFLGLWERLGWRYRHEKARFFSSPHEVRQRRAAAERRVALAAAGVELE